MNVEVKLSQLGSYSYLGILTYLKWIFFFSCNGDFFFKLNSYLNGKAGFLSVYLKVEIEMVNAYSFLNLFKYKRL